MTEIPTIRKSTFKVDKLNYRERSYYGISSKSVKNCFISPSGTVIKIEDDWHHIEVALDIIKRKDKEVQRSIQAVEYKIENNTRPFIPLRELNELQENLKELKKIHWEEDFKAVNRNRGFDAAEFLVIYHGYVALSDFNILYLSTTREQREILNVRFDKDDNGKEILKPLSENQIVFKNNRQKIIDKISRIITDYYYYTDSRNAFHCPSGIPRMGWGRFKTEAEAEYIKLSSDEYKKEISKYGLQLPKVNYSKHGFGMVEIDMNSFFIPGVKRELYEERKPRLFKA